MTDELPPRRTLREQFVDAALDELDRHGPPSARPVAQPLDPATIELGLRKVAELRAQLSRPSPHERPATMLDPPEELHR